MSHSPAQSVTSTRQGAGPPAEARNWLDQLRWRLCSGDDPRQALPLLDGLAEKLDRVLLEHAGLSEELLSVFEQLGVVFEVSRKLPTVLNETAVVDLFVNNLRRSFQGRSVWAARRGQEGEWQGQQQISSWLMESLDRSVGNASVLVESAPAGSEQPQPAQAMIGPVFAGDTFVCAIVLTCDVGQAEFRSGDMGLLQSLTTFCGDLIRNHRLVRELRTMSITMVRALVNAVDQKDEYTSCHSLRVAYYATLLGRDLDLSKADLRMLQWSALLHDVGKIGIRDSVLKKEGKLTAEEFEHMKEHPVRSHKVVQEVPQLADALPGVLHHHERYDGTGYPAGLSGENIPRQARIIQIADVFDALTSNRSYRPAFSWMEALSIMEKEAGKTVDPLLRQRFDDLIHRLLDGQAGAWERLVRQGNEFVQDTSLDEPLAEGKAP